MTDRLLTDEEIQRLPELQGIDDNQMIQYTTIKERIVAKAQDLKTARIKDAECQKRIDSLIEEIPKLSKWTEKHYDPRNNIGTPDMTGGVINLAEECYVIPVSKIDSLKQRERISKS